MYSYQQVLNLPSRTTYDHADFYISASNSLAYKWIETWPNWPNHCLILFGPHGCGKTHLAHIWQQKSGAINLPFSKLETENLDELCQTNKAIIVEDIPADCDPNILFHLYNSVQQAKSFLLFTSELAPNKWQIELPDLISRLHAAMWAEIIPADDELLKAMMKKVFSDEQLIVPEHILDYLLKHQDRSFSSILESIKKLNQYAMATKRKVTLPLVKEVLF